MLGRERIADDIALIHSLLPLGRDGLLTPWPYPSCAYCLVTMAQGFHPFPSRTRKLSPAAPMVLPLDGGRVGRCQAFFCLRFGNQPNTLMMKDDIFAGTKGTKSFGELVIELALVQMVRSKRQVVLTAACFS